MGSNHSCLCCSQTYSKGQQDKLIDDELRMTNSKQPLFNQVVKIIPEDDSSLLQIMATYDQLINRRSISTGYHCSSNKRSRSISVDNKIQRNNSHVDTKNWNQKKMAYSRSLSASQFNNNLSKYNTSQKPSSILKKRSNTQESQFQKKQKNKVSFFPFTLQCNNKKKLSDNF